MTQKGTQALKADFEKFLFRDLHPNIHLGTTTDRYSGWIGQVYSGERYAGRMSRRTRVVGDRSFVEETLPVESVEEYFEHFPILEVDYTFYRMLREKKGRPTQNFQVLKQYRQHMKADDSLVLKVPQAIFAQKLSREGKYSKNEDYLNAEAFQKQFYEPAVEVMGPMIRGFIFEQEYQRKADRLPPEKMAADLDHFFRSIPQDKRYHVELRTESYLSDPVFEILEKHGVGQVLSHWTWLPPLAKQFAKSGGKSFNSGKESVLRLITPIGIRYEEAYTKAFPFDKRVEGMMPPQMVEETVEILWAGVEKGIQMNLFINNRAGGNAPLIARDIAQEFLSKKSGARE
jgi:uncharacterized protein YecE (DUF72 family)